MVSILSQADVSRLLAEPSSQARLELAGKLAQELDNPQLTEAELKLAQDIVRVMARDVESSVRQGLAQSLRKVSRMPYDVALKLANDIETVALPVLEHCSLLTDDDLASIVHNSDAAAKHVAIASRAHVPEKVSHALIEKAGEKAIAALMGNNGAKISEASLSKAADRFAASPDVKERMVKRESLPPAIAERLVALVSDSLKEYLVQHHEMSPSIATDLVMQTRERTVVNLSNRATEGDLEKLVQQMHRNQRLTPTLVLRALCMGDIAFFETAMAVMANVPVVNARILIHDAGGLGLKSLYAKTALPPRLLPAIKVAIDVVKETPLDGGLNDRQRTQNRIIERILTQYDGLAQDDMDYLVAKLNDVLGTAA